MEGCICLWVSIKYSLIQYSLIFIKYFIYADIFAPIESVCGSLKRYLCGCSFIPIMVQAITKLMNSVSKADLHLWNGKFIFQYHRHTKTQGPNHPTWGASRRISLVSSTAKIFHKVLFWWLSRFLKHLPTTRTERFPLSSRHILPNTCFSSKVRRSCASPNNSHLRVRRLQKCLYSISRDALFGALRACSHVPSKLLNAIMHSKSILKPLFSLWVVWPILSPKLLVFCEGDTQAHLLFVLLFDWVFCMVLHSDTDGFLSYMHAYSAHSEKRLYILTDDVVMSPCFLQSKGHNKHWQTLRRRPPKSDYSSTKSSKSQVLSVQSDLSANIRCCDHAVIIVNVFTSCHATDLLNISVFLASVTFRFIRHVMLYRAPIIMIACDPNSTKRSSKPSCFSTPSPDQRTRLWENL